MTLYSKNGSIPKPQTDGTPGWVAVPDKPVAKQGEEVIWWYPPGWVVRPVQPAPEAGSVWDWSQSEGKWVKTVVVVKPTDPAAPAPIPAPIMPSGNVSL